MTELGLIEGFYGYPWTWQERAETISFLAPHGYRSYLYAPKPDPYLRRRWQEPHPEGEAAALAGLAAHCRGLGVRFGIGLSPYDAFRDFGATAQQALAGKLAFFADVGADDVAILFDDMRGDLPRLAAQQAELVAFAAERAAGARLMVCPSYYSDDPILDRVFGRRPERYLEELGERLDPGIEIFWTGEEVCSREYAPAHLQRVATVLGRPPLLWDNYPVNDSSRMSQHLHLRAFTGRPAALGGCITRHLINAALQPVLTRIPALTLVESYERGGDYEYGAALRRAAAAVLGEPLGTMVWEDLAWLNDVGLERLGTSRIGQLRARYGDHEHPGAREILAWLEGRYRVTDEMVQAQ